MKLFGRDKIIESMWSILEDNSILFTAERRQGKTKVLESMYENPKAGFIVIFQVLEKVSTPIEFVNCVIKDLNACLSKGDRLKAFSKDFFKKLGGSEIAGVIKLPESEAEHWKELLQEVIIQACENNPNHNIVFLWDEIPYMLQLIDTAQNKEDGLSLSLEVLNVLRALRQEKKNLRMVLTGSIGIHHVLKEIKSGVSARPINDLDIVNLPKISLTHAKDMARYRLTEKEKLLQNPSDDILETIATEADCIPFYIEKVIKELAKSDDEITPANIRKTVNTILVDGNDNWDLEHFRSRLEDYYQGTINYQGSNSEQQDIARHKVAKEILNHVAVSLEPQSLSDIFKPLKTRFKLSDMNVAHTDAIKELLKLLVKDHYLLKTPSKGYSFNFSIVQRWWVEAEELV